MKPNIWMLVILGFFFTIADIAYGIWTFLDQGSVEPIGTAAIACLVILSFFIAFFLWSGDRRAGLLPEDNIDGEIADSAGEVGFFSPWSWWPFVLGCSLAVMFASLAVGWWLFFVAAPFALVGLVGFVFEYSRGAHAH